MQIASILYSIFILLFREEIPIGGGGVYDKIRLVFVAWGNIDRAIDRKCRVFQSNKGIWICSNSIRQEAIESKSIEKRLEVFR